MKRIGRRDWHSDQAFSFGKIVLDGLNAGSFSDFGDHVTMLGDRQMVVGSGDGLAFF